MAKLSVSLFLILCITFYSLNAQTAPDVQSTQPSSGVSASGSAYPNTRPSGPSSGISVSGYAYPISALAAEHASFVINYPISNKLEAELQGFYNTYLFSNRLRLAALVKWNLSHRLFIFSGLESEFEMSKWNPEMEVAPNTLLMRPPRIGFISGVRYDVQENISLEAKMNLQVNDSPVGVYGEHRIPMPKVYTLGGKVKF